MARIRTIKPEFFTDEDIAKLPPLYRIAFEGLWCQADKAGRLEDRPARLKVQILPYDNVDFGEVLTALAAARFVSRYTGPDGRAYLQIRSFEKHQRPRPDEPESEIPEGAGDTGSDTTPLLRSTEPVTAQLLGKEGNGKERNGGVSTEPPGDSAPPVLTFPTVGPHDATWALRTSQLAEWRECFPSQDVLAECRKALAWVLANPGRKKTARGMPKFLVGWLSRANDRGRHETPTRRAAEQAPAYSNGWDCDHVDRCGHRGMCDHKHREGAKKYPVKAVPV